MEAERGFFRCFDPGPLHIKTICGMMGAPKRRRYFESWSFCIHITHRMALALADLVDLADPAVLVALEAPVVPADLEVLVALEAPVDPAVPRPWAPQSPVQPRS